MRVPHSAATLTPLSQSEKILSTGLERYVGAFAAWLTPRRLRAHALVLAVCLWAVFIADYAVPGIFDRAGNIKFQDFATFSTAAQLIAHGRAGDLYRDPAFEEAIRSIAGRESKVRLVYLYGPQVALAFVPFTRFPFLVQAQAWAGLTVLIYFACVYLLWRACPYLRPYAGLVTICAIGYPPLFHVIVRGQLSAVTVTCFTAACLAFLADQEWLCGFALGCLMFKPSFLVAIPLILLFARAWKILAACAISAAAQVALASALFGQGLMRQYANSLLQNATNPNVLDIGSPVQRHSLAAFWSLLIPWTQAVWVLYLLSSLIVIGLATLMWRSSGPRGLRFSGLILAAILIDPHLYVYDLLALAPVFLIAADWILGGNSGSSRSWLAVLLYLAFLLPLFGPLSRWTHLQLSVPVLCVLLWVLWRQMPAITVNRPRQT